MSATLKLVNNDPPGCRWIANFIAAGKAANDFDVDIVILRKSDAGDDAKAPAIYLNDTVLAEIGSLRDGKITEEELLEELRKANVPKTG